MDIPDKAPGQPLPGDKLQAAVIATGAGGIRAAAACQALVPHGLAWLSAHTSQQPLQVVPASGRLLMGSNRNHHFGAGGDPSIGHSSASDHADEIKEAVAGKDIVFVITSLGGGTGSGAAPVIAEVAREAGALVLVIAITPFDGEGPLRSQKTRAALDQLRALSDAVICFSNQRLLKFLGSGRDVIETFARANDMFAQGFSGIWRMLENPGIVRLDFGHLYTLLRGRHVQTAFASAQARGEGRALEAMRQLVSSPLLDEGAILQHAGQVIVSIAGGPDLSFADIEVVTDQVRRACETTNFTVGTSIDPDLAGAISVTLLAAQPEERKGETVVPRTSSGRGEDIDTTFFNRTEAPRTRPRAIPPPPETTQDAVENLLARQGSAGGRKRKKSKSDQFTFNFEIASKGRFEDSIPTIHNGEDMDMPTYIRRGIRLS